MSEQVIKNTNPAEKGEQLSALMDGELSREQVRFLLRSVEIESDLARRWSSYHIVGATLRREFVALPLCADFSSAVLARLDADSVAVPASRGYAVLRWVGGGAIAAAVTVVALVVSRPVDNPAPGTSAATMIVQQAVPQAQPVRQAPVYLPLAPNPAPLTGFDANRVMQASFDTVMPNLYAPNGELSRSKLSDGAAPYVFYVNPMAQRPLFPQQGAPPPDARQNRAQQ